jgi:hypothetical protein
MNASEIKITAYKLSNAADEVKKLEAFLEDAAKVSFEPLYGGGIQTHHGIAVVSVFKNDSTSTFRTVAIRSEAIARAIHALVMQDIREDLANAKEAMEQARRAVVAD